MPELDSDAASAPHALVVDDLVLFRQRKRNRAPPKDTRLADACQRYSEVGLEAHPEKVHDFAPLAEVKFCHLLSYNVGTNVFRHRIGERQTADLLRLLAYPEEAPQDNALPYETNGYRRTIPENPKFRDQRRAAYGE